MAGAFIAPIAVFALPVGLVDHETEWVRLVGIIGAVLASALCVIVVWALAADLREGWQRGEIDLDTVAYTCGFGLTPLVIGFACYAAGIGAAP